MRVLLRLVSPLLGLAVAALGFLVALESAWALARSDSDPLAVPWREWRDDLETHDWNETVVTVIAASAVGIGVLLLLLASTARRHDIALSAPAPDVTVVTTPRSVARVVGHRVRTSDGVRSATVTASGRRIRVRATSRLYDEKQLRPVLTERLHELVKTIPFEHPPKLNIVIDSPKDRP